MDGAAHLQGERAIALTLSASLTMSMAHAEVRHELELRAETDGTVTGRETRFSSMAPAAALTFKAVTRDSRCPKDVRCIRAGEAVVVLELRDGSHETSTLTFDVPPGGGASQSLRGYRIDIVSLDPQAEADVEIAPRDYTATIGIKVM